MEIQVTDSNYPFFAALASETRLKIIKLLSQESQNIGQLAASLELSSAIVTRHVNLLEQAGLIKSQSLPGKRGRQKVCSLSQERITLLFPKHSEYRIEHVSIPIGQFVAHQVRPSCGLASREGLIGICDDPRYFSDPGRTAAAIVWFQTGWVEYSIPSFVFSQKQAVALELSVELCSEHPGYNENWPSDIHFYLNDKLVGIWTSPGDFGKEDGIYTPSWWHHGTKYGLLKTLRITAEGSFIDGTFLTPLTLSDLELEYGKDLPFRIEVPENAKNPGGINIFGRGFGNYDQDLEVRLSYL